MNTSVEAHIEKAEAELAPQLGTAGHTPATANLQAVAPIETVLFDVLMSCEFRHIHRPFRPADVARELNKRGIPSSRGKQWHRKTATRLLARLPQVVSDAGAAKLAAWEERDRESRAANSKKPTPTVSEALTVLSKARPGD